MQDYLPKIQALLSDWYLLTINNPLYAGALVLTVWLCLVFFYNIKILFLKKQQKLSDQGRIDLQSQLETTQQALKQSEEKLVDSTQQAEQNTQAAADFVGQVKERNLTIVAAIRSLAAKFDLNEQLVGSDSDMKAEFIWQQQDNIVAQLAERLESAQQANNERETVHQQEIKQLTEKEALINSLHATLDAQTKQFAQLEQALEAQKLRQQEQQNEAQQLLANTLEKHQLDFTRLLNDLKNPKSVQTQSVEEVPVAETTKTEAVVEEVEPINEPEAPISEATIQPVSPISTDIQVDAVIPEVIEPLVNEVPEVNIPAASLTSEKINDEIPKTEPVVPPKSVSEPEIVQPDIVNIIRKETPVADEIEPEEINYNVSSLHLGRGFKGLLGKITAKKKSKDKSVVEQSEQVEKKAKKSPLKLKGLYNKLASKGKGDGNK